MLRLRAFVCGWCRWHFVRWNAFDSRPRSECKCFQSNRWRMSRGIQIIRPRNLPDYNLQWANCILQMQSDCWLWRWNIWRWSFTSSKSPTLPALKTILRELKTSLCLPRPMLKNGNNVVGDLSRTLLNLWPPPPAWVEAAFIMVLIFSNSLDFHTDVMINQTARWKDVFRLNTEYLHRDYDFTLYPNEKRFEIKNTVNGKVVCSSDITCAWWRRPEKIKISDDDAPQMLHAFLTDEYRLVLRGLINILEQNGCRIVTDPSILNRAKDKTIQQIWAKECGFRLPNQIITTSNHAFDHYFKNEPQLVSKSIDSIESIRDEERNKDFNLLRTSFRNGTWENRTGWSQNQRELLSIQNPTKSRTPGHCVWTSVILCHRRLRIRRRLRRVDKTASISKWFPMPL